MGGGEVKNWDRYKVTRAPYKSPRCVVIFDHTPREVVAMHQPGENGSSESGDISLEISRGGSTPARSEDRLLILCKLWKLTVAVFREHQTGCGVAHIPPPDK